MSATKLDPPQVSTSKRAPLSVYTEAHLDTQSAALIEAYPQRLYRNIQPPKIKTDKQKPPLSFCPTCQMLLKITSSHPLALKCKKCGYKQELDQNVVFNAKQTYQHNEIAVLEKEEQLRTYPIVQAICEKCGKTESETWTVAVGSEGAISSWVFLRCISCGNTRREVG
jgi:DNA-directed RNA polymerase subunit M/transcription elongation factor TFIIS